MSWLDTLEGLYSARDFSQLPPEERQRAARDVINLSALASCGAVAAPLPFSNLLLATPIHIGMVVAVGHVYGRSLSRDEARSVVLRLAGVAGASLATRQIWITISKLIAPGVGGFLFLPYVYAATWGLGRLAMLTFEDESVSGDVLRKQFGDFVDEGRRGFRMDDLRDFLRRRGDGAKDAPTAEQSPEQPHGEAVDARPAPVEARWEDEEVTSAPDRDRSVQKDPKSAKSTKSAKSAKSTKSSKSAKSTKSAKSAKSSKSSKGSKGSKRRSSRSRGEKGGRDRAP